MSQPTKREKLRKKSFSELVEAGRGLMKDPKYARILNIRFPYYRNLLRDEKLIFGFPLTVFTGPNGCGKSSVLQALYGAPEGYSVGRYWFSTEVDPIAESLDGMRPSFVYEYRDAEGKVFQPIKTRIRKKFPGGLLQSLRLQESSDPDKINDPNYWEPSRPLAWAGQSTRKDGSRDPAMEREVIYLHFRTQLSAFEAAFFGNGVPSTETREHLRRKSRYLNRVLAGLAAHAPRGRAQSRLPEAVSKVALAEVNEIVGKEYLEANVVTHKFFGTSWGDSVRFKLADATYSDAFAGSGEAAVFRLVRALDQAKDGALVILDEPEISLHPEAQRRMLKLLLCYAIEKRLQIFLATHSSNFVDGLPDDAIFLFERAASGRFTTRNVPAPLALASIGHSISRKTILVEDEMARRLTQAALKAVDEAALRLFEVKVAPGGASAVYAALALDHSGNVHGILDGDQRPDESCHEDAVKLLALKDPGRAALDNLIGRITRDNAPKFHSSGDGDSGDASPDEAIRVRVEFLNSVLKRAHFIPGNGNPEDLIGAPQVVSELLLTLGAKMPRIEELSVEGDGDAKKLIYEASIAAGVSIPSLQEMLVASWVNLGGQGLAEFKTLLANIISCKEPS